jgi:hypothetical protein
MRRTELEAALKERGWAPTGQASGTRHTLWRHARRRRPLAVPNQELILDSVAEALIAEAEG